MPSDPTPLPRRSGAGRIPSVVLSLALATVLAATAVHLVVRQGFLDNMDERNYLWLADRLLEGRVTTEAAPPEIRDHFTVMWRAEYQDRSYTVFPVGWPGLLAVGRSINLQWLVNPILAGLCIVLLYGLARLLYGDERVARRSVVLAALCPLLVFQAGTLLSHVATSFWLLLALLALLMSVRREVSVFAFLGGLAFGLAASTRPLDALAIALPAGLAYAAHYRSRLAILVRRSALIVAGGLLGLLPFLAYNRAITGDARVTPQQIYGFPDHLLAVSVQEWLTETVPRTLLQLQAWQMWFVPIVVVALGAGILLARGVDRRDVVVTSLIVSFILAYSLNVAYYDIAGPRYHLLLVFPSCVLLARCSTTLTVRQAVVAMCVVAASYVATYAFQVPTMFAATSLKRSLDISIARGGITRAIIFLPDGWRFGMNNSDRLDNGPRFEGIVYARDLPATNSAVLDYFPGLPAYRWPSAEREPPGALTEWTPLGVDSTDPGGEE